MTTSATLTGRNSPKQGVADKDAIIARLKDSRGAVGEILKLKEEFGTSAVGRALGVHPAHISLVTTRGISPSMEAAYYALDILTMPEKRHRRAADFGRGEDGERLAREFDSILAGNGETMTSLCLKILARAHARQIPPVDVRLSVTVQRRGAS